MPWFNIILPIIDCENLKQHKNDINLYFLSASQQCEHPVRRYCELHSLVGNSDRSSSGYNVESAVWTV